jgi:hypothetical protein
MMFRFLAFAGHQDNRQGEQQREFVHWLKPIAIATDAGCMRQGEFERRTASLLHEFLCIDCEQTRCRNALYEANPVRQ